MKKKFSPTGLVFILLGLVVLVLSFVFSTKLFGETSIFNQNITENNAINTLYQKIPAVIKTVDIIFVAWLLHKLFKLFLSKIFAHSKRSLTIIKLLTSFIKYLFALVCILLILSAFGVDTKTLLASAGILGLVIGLGAQSLIADIIAGLFIVFEGEFEVGDIVVVDGWRGTVSEIGIRTTKIYDAGGNIKVINNSHISSIINQTKELSVAKVTVGIEYGAHIQQVEKVIMDNLERMKNIPGIVEGPFYKGVDALAESSVNLLFIAKCKEEDIYGVQRALNREIKIIFDENNINIPFPQVTFSQLEEPKDNKRIKTGKVNEFVNEQRELSKNVEDNN